jgi:seryl-tRNA synthetase
LDERRPHSNVPAKQRELEELARLIQAATGTVDLAVETSQQLSSQNQIYQRFAERTAAKQKQGQVVESGDNLHKITKQIDEANHNDNQILSDLDMIIHNLENQQ